MTLTLALDLEGTLISNAVSQIPRPGLREFLAFCFERFERVVIFSAVSRPRVEAVLRQLDADGALPQGVSQALDIVDWSGPYKDLRFIEGTSPKRALLVDDLASYVHPDQRDRWIPIPPFVSPYPDDDNALEALREALVQALAETPKTRAASAPLVSTGLFIHPASLLAF